MRIAEIHLFQFDLPAEKWSLPDCKRRSLVVDNDAEKIDVR